jgi:dephospho-CoA kinase
LGRSQKTQPLGSARPTVEVWGLTGGIASGKTTVGKFFSELGIPVVDADLISRDLSLQGGAAHAEIVKRFGTAEREKLRTVIFENASARQELERILHPHIIRVSQTEFERLSQETGSRIVIYEASLLVETKRYKSLQGLIVVESPEKTRKERLISRNGFSSEMAEKILSAQTSDEKRREAATTIIENFGSLDELRGKVHQFALASGWISS